MDSSFETQTATANPHARLEASGRRSARCWLSRLCDYLDDRAELYFEPARLGLCSGDYLARQPTGPFALLGPFQLATRTELQKRHLRRNMGH